MNRLKTEFDRCLVRESRLEALGDVKPLVQEQHDRAHIELTRFMDRAAGIRKQQKHFLDIFELIGGIDFHVRASSKKAPGEENVIPEHLAIQKLAAFTGTSKVRRNDGQIVRVNYLDDYKGLSDARTMFFFSTQPRPGVYAFPLDGREITFAPVYEPITLEEKKNEK